MLWLQVAGGIGRGRRLVFGPSIQKPLSLVWAKHVVGGYALRYVASHEYNGIFVFKLLWPIGPKKTRKARGVQRVWHVFLNLALASVAEAVWVGSVCAGVDNARKVHVNHWHVYYAEMCACFLSQCLSHYALKILASCEFLGTAICNVAFS